MSRTCVLAQHSYPGRDLRRQRLLAPLLCILATLVVASPAAAQYFYFDTNGDGVSTWADSLNGSGSTTVDVWLNTGQNRDGSPGFCGSPGLATYEFILQALGGTVTWGTYTSTLAGSGVLQDNSNASEHYIAAVTNPPGTTTPLGAYKLGTISVTPASGAPCLGVAASSGLSPRFRTSFGTGCAGGRFDHTARFGAEWASAEVLPSRPSAPPFVTAPGIVVPKYLDPVSVQVQVTPATCGAVSSLNADLSTLPPGNNAVFTSGPSNLTGTLTWQPTAADHGEFMVTFTAAGRNPSATAAKTTVIHLVTDATSVDDSQVEPVLSLWQNRPNPFTPSTTIFYSVPRETRASLVVFDIAGRSVARLVDRVMSAGPHEVHWAGRDDAGRTLASGVYIYRLTTKYGAETRRLVLAR